jgi:hypothetical protein
MKDYFVTIYDKEADRQNPVVKEIKRFMSEKDLFHFLQENKNELFTVKLLVF